MRFPAACKALGIPPTQARPAPGRGWLQPQPPFPQPTRLLSAPRDRDEGSLGSRAAAQPPASAPEPRLSPLPSAGTSPAAAPRLPRGRGRSNGAAGAAAGRGEKWGEAGPRPSPSEAARARRYLSCRSYLCSFRLARPGCAMAARSRDAQARPGGGRRPAEAVTGRA